MTLTQVLEEKGLFIVMKPNRCLVLKAIEVILIAQTHVCKRSEVAVIFYCKMDFSQHLGGRKICKMHRQKNNELPIKAGNNMNNSTD